MNKINFVKYDGVRIERHCEVKVVNGMTIGGESDGNFCWICGWKVGFEVWIVIFVCQHKALNPNERLIEQLKENFNAQYFG